MSLTSLSLNIINALKDSKKHHPMALLCVSVGLGSFTLGCTITQLINIRSVRFRKSNDRENAGASREHNSGSFYFGASKESLQVCMCVG